MNYFLDDEQSQSQLLQAQRKREKQKTDLEKILSLPEGRRFLWRLLEETKVFQNSFTGCNQTFFNEGRRDIGLFLMNELFDVKPEALTQLRAEHKADEAAERARK